MTHGDASASLGVRLKPSETPPDGWDRALIGERAGLRVTALARWVDGSGGEIRFNFKPVSAKASVNERLRAMEFLEMVDRGGELVVTDIGRSKRPPVRVTVPAGCMPPEGRALLALLQDLVTIEARAGVAFDLPETLNASDIAHIAYVARLISTGQQSVTWRDARLTVTSPEALQQLNDGGVMRIEHSASTEVLGRDVALGIIRRDIPAYVVHAVTPREGDPAVFDIGLRPPDAEAAKIEDVLLPASARTREAPPPPPRKVAKQRKKNRGKSKKRRK